MPIVQCPLCKKPSDPAYAPFCSDRCKKVDLHRWLSGAYVVPTTETPDQNTEEDLG